MAHLEHRPPSENLKIGVSVPGECPERKYTHSTVRNGKEVAIFVPLRTYSKTVAQIMWLGVGYKVEMVRHSLGKAAGWGMI